MKYLVGDNIFIDGDTFIIFKKDRVLFRSENPFDFDIFSLAEKVHKVRFERKLGNKIKKFVKNNATKKER